MTISIKATTKTKEELLMNIQSLRDELVKTGLKDGLNGDSTIEISTKLDHYILMYQKLQLKYKVQ